MRCPVDKTDLIVVEHQKIEVDYCQQCAGVWFDSGELDLLIQTEEATEPPADLLTPDKASTSESRRKCPICGSKMDKIWMGKEPKILIDSCPKGDGLWFDGGELHQVLKQIHPAGSKTIISFLGDTLQAAYEPGENQG